MVAHFHYVLFGTIVFATYAGIYFWFPKMTGRMMDETLGKVHFWLTFIGFHTTFLVQHWLGNEGMPRRYADYLPSDGFTTLNMISSIGAFVLGASTLPFIWNVFRSYRYGRVVTVDDPWGFGNSLEWATSCPPPRHNFTELPRIRSERPAFELHYPHLVERFRHEAHVGGKADQFEAAAQAAGGRAEPERRPQVPLARARTTTVLITVTGPDRPGVSSVLFAALTRHGVDLLDVEQVVIRGRLTLGALVAAHHDPEGLQEAVEQAMASIAMQVQTSLEVADDPAGAQALHARRRGARAADHRAGVRVDRAGAGRRRRQHRRDPPGRRLPGHRAGAAGLAGAGPGLGGLPARHAAQEAGRRGARGGRRRRRGAGRAGAGAASG